MHSTFKFSVSLIALIVASQANAAQLLDLKNHDHQILRSFVNQPMLRSQSISTIKEINRYVDFNHMTHIRLQQYFQNYPVWDAQAMMHVPERRAHHKLMSELVRGTATQKSMNGQLYQKLEDDLKIYPNIVFSEQQSKRAIQFVINTEREKAGKGQNTIDDVKSSLLVFIDKTQHHQAHWAYKIALTVRPSIQGDVPSKPVYIVDAMSFKIYKNWNDIKTAAPEYEFVPGGGYGGNPNIGKLRYDGLANHLASFSVTREGDRCYLINNDMEVDDAVSEKVMSFIYNKPVGLLFGTLSIPVAIYKQFYEKTNEEDGRKAPR